MDGRHGVYLCEGNHDLIENGREFRRATRAAGVPLLVNEAAAVRVRGVDVQLLGLRWGTGVQGAGRAADRGDGAIATALKELLPSLRPASEAFPILMAHHPHALDHAAAAGIPLTLSGHGRRRCHTRFRFAISSGARVVMPNCGRMSSRIIRVFRSLPPL